MESTSLAWPDCPPSSGPVVLRPFCPGDVAMARDMATDHYAPLIGTLPAHADEAQALAWIERQPERFTRGAGYSFAIAEADSGVALGVIGMMLRRHGRASVETTPPGERPERVLRDGRTACRLDRARQVYGQSKAKLPSDRRVERRGLGVHGAAGPGRFGDGRDRLVDARHPIE